jgi:NAD(P)-dependent dehydrogenase (short-subunit alcohol dehydrogenase family)
MAVRADVDDELDVERLFTETIEAFGAIDAVVHAVRGRVTATSVAKTAWLSSTPAQDEHPGHLHRQPDGST